MRPLTAHNSSWATRAGFLADFAMAHLVNRTDVWGQYIPPDRRLDPDRKTFTAPPVVERGTTVLTRDMLVGHFRGEYTIGLHAVSPDNTCLWCAFDIDAHMEGAEDEYIVNVERVAHITAVLRSVGCHPIVEQSCDRGGFHIWTVFDQAIETARVFAFVQAVLRQAGVVGVETFPKQPHVPPDRFGSWLRLPGRHHSRPHWSRISVDDRWVEGSDAALAFMYTRLTPATAIPAVVPILPPPMSRVEYSTRVNAPNDFIERRVLAYAAKIGYGLSDSRKRAAFSFASFLIHNLGLSSNATLQYCHTWNSYNMPPLSDSEMVAIVRNAEKYGHPSRGRAA